MRNMIFAGALALGLSGCAGTIPGIITVPGIDPAVISNIQATATQLCGFVPTATTVANIVTTFTGGGGAVGVISEVANAICAAVTKKAFRRGGRRGVAITATVRGVLVKGSFVR